MQLDPDIVHSLSQKMMAVSFIYSSMFLLRNGNFFHSIFYLLAFIDTYARLRYPFHTWVRNQLIDQDSTVEHQRMIQKILIGLSCFVVAALATACWPYWKRLALSGKFMVMGTILVLFVLMLELISLHAIDAIIYQPAGPLFVASWVYVIGALITGTAAIKARSEALRGKRSKATESKP